MSDEGMGSSRQIEIRERTSRNLPHAPFPNAESSRGSAYLDRDSTNKDEKDHLHLPAVLTPLEPARG